MNIFFLCLRLLAAADYYIIMYLIVICYSITVSLAADLTKIKFRSQLLYIY